MSTLLRISVISVAAFCLVPTTAQAGELDATVARSAPSEGCDQPEALSIVERRIVDKASQGATPLIRFVHATRGIYQLDVYDTVAWLDKRRAARAACGIAVADAAAPAQ
jgi:hypothetical protein